MKDVSLFENKAIGTDPDIVVVRGNILDNHVVSGGILTDEAIWEFAKGLLDKPSEWNARIEGEPKHFAGIVYGDQLDREFHVEQDFEAPETWTFYEGIDPHDGKPTNWGFFAVSNERFILPESKRSVFRAYMVDWLSIAGKPISAIVKDVHIKRASLGYWRPEWVVLDAKYGRRAQQTGDKRTSWQLELQKNDKGITYILSDSSPGSVEIGHKIVKEYLVPKYSTLRNEKVSSFSFMQKCDGGIDSPVQGFFAYAYDEEGKLKEAFKDWPDVIRYFLTKFPKYRERQGLYGRRDQYKDQGTSAWAV